ERGVPSFVVFGDVTLQDLARRRPTDADGFRAAHGVGDQKARQYAEQFTLEIARYCAVHGIETDVSIGDGVVASSGLESLSTKSKSDGRVAAEGMFRLGLPL